MNIYDPSQWSDVHGYVVLLFAMGTTLLWLVVKLIDGAWTDWLDERSGRGSVRDTWMLDRVDRERSRKA